MQSRSWLVAIVLFLLCPWLFAQKVPAGPVATDVAAGPDSATVEKVIRDQFGKGYKLLPGYAPLVADFDGDGVQDLAVAAKANNPLLNAVEFHYTVIDPYHSFFGYGNANTMMEYGADDPRLEGQVVVIIHGAADGAWRAAQPKSKFVVVNLPYIRLSLSHVLRHKKPLAAVAAEEPDKVTSVVYWDGKKYKYEPMGADAD
ncbi:MAG TPA: FG-GAP repeat protein [Terriglobales bacterium]|jgi:FG-GAP repeat|nr:FG-GAP repeat protein [Terriglobales bacterium]